MKDGLKLVSDNKVVNLNEAKDSKMILLIHRLVDERLQVQFDRIAADIDTLGTDISDLIPGERAKSLLLELTQVYETIRGMRVVMFGEEKAK